MHIALPRIIHGNVQDDTIYSQNVKVSSIVLFAQNIAHRIRTPLIHTYAQSGTEIEKERGNAGKDSERSMRENRRRDERMEICAYYR